MKKTSSQENPIRDDEILHDVSPAGKVRPWAEKKKRNIALSEVYLQVDPKKARRLEECGQFLSFVRRPQEEGGGLRLQAANFCRIRLCPMCQWRKSLKAYSQMRKILDWCRENSKFRLRYIFCTLTVQNCQGEELASTINLMMKGFDRLMRYSAIAGPKSGPPVVKGWYRSLEITHDVDEIISRKRYNKARKYYDARGISPGDKNPGFDTYHPHFHVLWAVEPSYFKTKDYISQKKLTELWKKAARLDYPPQVDIRIVKGVDIGDISQTANESFRYIDENIEEIGMKSAVCEITKYATKDSDYVIPDDYDLSVRSVQILDKALEKRRLIARGGIFAEAWRALGLDEPEDGDLVHLDSENEDIYNASPDVVYVWHSGYFQYRLE